jgi:hypothetical protein
MRKGPSVARFLNFHSKVGGTTNLYELRDMLNSGQRQKDIAAAWNVNRGHLCENIDNAFDVVYIFKPEIEEVLRNLAAIEQQKREDYVTHTANILRLTASGDRGIETTPRQVV